MEPFTLITWVIEEKADGTLEAVSRFYLTPWRSGPRKTSSAPRRWRTSG
jgi:hypothetical protein